MRFIFLGKIDNSAYSIHKVDCGCSGTASCTVTLIAARNVTATFDLVAPRCYTLTLSHTGQGSDPFANPANSAGCPSGQLVEDEMIHLSGAIPDDGWGISAWTGTSLDASRVGTNSLSMPAKDHATSGIYRAASYLPAIYGIIPTGEQVLRC